MTKNTLWRKAVFGMLFAGLMLFAFPDTGYAMTVDFNARVAELKVKFPEGAYWNHVGGAENPDGYTNTPCVCHNTGVCIMGTGNCTCNHYIDLVEPKHNQSTQCMGFANKLGFDVFGMTTWTRSTENAVANIRTGDIVRLDGDTHSVFIIARTGNSVVLGEANYSGKCRISWSRTIDLSAASITYYERADNYETVLGTVTAAPEVTDPSATGGASKEEGNIPADFTGWKQTADGLHFVYAKNGELQKSKWITVNKQKYYLDADGYRVVGLYLIGDNRYYFNDEGVLQSKQWIVVDGQDYYIGEEGFALKSQWLYLGNTLVYVTGDGSVAKKELVKIGSNTYYFNAKGKRSKGFKNYQGKYYYCNSKGIIQKKKWITKGGKKYYLQKSGVRAEKKLLTIGKYKYYFNAKGQMVKNKKVVYKDKVYKADRNGHCKFLYYADEE
ncbi:MAG: hypothetical protein NC124_11655 [Clostridium sp.]|nr:hypothetical protein [Clostridium sp.]